MSSVVESEAKGKRGDKGGPVLVPQKHGGALLSGGQKGQTPGTGRPKSEVRQAAREIGYAALQALAVKQAEGKLSDSDVARLGELGMKYGMGEAAPEAVADAEVVARIFRYLKEERGIDPGELRDYEAWERDRY